MIAAAFPIVLEAAVRSLLGALVVWAALGLLRVRNVPAQKAAWTLVLFSAFAMPLAARWHWLPAIETIPLPATVFARPATIGLSSARYTSAAVPSTDLAPLTASGPNSLPAPSISENAVANADLPSVAAGSAPAKGVAAPDVRRLASASQPAAPANRPWPIRPLALAGLLYLAVAAVLLGRLIAGLISAFRLWSAAKPVPAVSPVLNLSELFTRRVAVRASSRVSSPVNIASGIVLPSGFRSWDAEKLRIVLAHECSHVREGDFYLQLLASFYAALFWFSPLGWWLKRKLSELGEAIGDRAGLEEATSRSSYAQLLLEFASLPHPTLTGVAMARTGNLAPRVERLLDESSFIDAFAASRRHALLAALVVPAALFVSTAFVRVQAAAQPQRAPQIAAVSVSPAAQRPEPPAARHVRASVPAPAAAPAQPVNAESALPAPIKPPAPTFLTAVFLRTPLPPGNLIASAAPPVSSLPVPGFAAIWAAPAAAIGLENAPPNSFERTLSFNGQLQLSVSTGSGNIHIVSGPGSRLHVVGQIKVSNGGSEEQASEIAANPPIEQTGNIVRIGAHQEQWHGISISYEIEAPADTVLNATSGSGNIGDAGVGQNARLNTGSGDIHATGLQGAFAVQTGSGNIYAGQTGEGDVKAQTGSGDLELKDVHGALQAQTGSGNIKVTGTPSQPWRLQTGSGNIELWPGDAPLTLDASTGSGSIHSDHQMMMQGALNRHHINATLNGGGPTVRAGTGSGDIRIH
jgi:beta-lactamase regulating signal transducer with metallopeptidase domain